MFSALMFAAGCSRQPAPVAEAPQPAAAPAAPVWADFVAEFIEARFKAEPNFAVQAGRHEYDGQMPDWSRAALDGDVAQLRAFLGRLGQFTDAQLAPAERIEREYLRWVIETEVFWRGSAEWPLRNPAWYLEKLDPSMYLTREYAPLPRRLEGFLGYARAIPRLAADIRANLRTPLPRPYIERGAAGFAGYAAFFRKDMPSVIAQAGNAELERALTEASSAAATAMDDLAKWLESQRATASDDFALGAARFSEMLRVAERVDVPLEELELVGRKDLERNLAALGEACAAFAPRAKLSACVERMRANKPAGGTVEGARAQLVALREFVRDRDIVTIPNQEQALVAESPPFNRGNFAYISIPGPFEDAAVKATYYVAPPDANWSTAQRNAYLPGRAYLLYVSVHEVWPGHYLHSQFSNRNPSRVASLWWNYSFGEGWAHYTEEMMYDAGLGKDQPEMRVGMLTNALLRDVRYLSAICLHAGCMSLEESEKMFRETAFADAGNARQQAVRGTYDPGYLAYTLGKLMIRKLRADWHAANPGASAREFHDRFLSYGSPPVPLVRQEMLGSASPPL
jgi:uncharacterized protein (DUF885 family)